MHKAERIQQLKRNIWALDVAQIADFKAFGVFVISTVDKYRVKYCHKTRFRIRFMCSPQDQQRIQRILPIIASWEPPPCGA